MTEVVRRTPRAAYCPDVVVLTPVHAGRVTPRTILSDHTARIVVLAMDAGTEMKEHEVRHPLLLQVLDGHVRVTLAEDGFDLRPGGLLLLEPSVAHAVRAVETSRLSLTLLLADGAHPGSPDPAL